eukprot:gene10556-9276_t
MQCMKDAGYDSIVVRSHRSIGDIDHNAVASMQDPHRPASSGGTSPPARLPQAKAVGFRDVDAYHFPCAYGQDPRVQIRNNVNNLRDNGLTDF